MSGIAWMVVLALGIPGFVFLGYAMFWIRGRYLYDEDRSGDAPGGIQDQKYESDPYGLERYGCVSLLATVLGAFFYIMAVIGFVLLVYQIVVIVLIPSLPTIISVVGVLYALILVLSFVLFIVMMVFGFFADLFKPPR